MKKFSKFAVSLIAFTLASAPLAHADNYYPISECKKLIKPNSAKRLKFQYKLGMLHQLGDTMAMTFGGILGAASSFALLPTGAGIVTGEVTIAGEGILLKDFLNTDKKTSCIEELYPNLYDDLSAGPAVAQNRVKQIRALPVPSRPSVVANAGSANSGR